MYIYNTIYIYKYHIPKIKVYMYTLIFSALANTYLGYFAFALEKG